MLINSSMRLSNMMGYIRSQKTSEAYNAFLKKEPLFEEILSNDSTPQEIVQGNRFLMD